MLSIKYAVKALYPDSTLQNIKQVSCNFMITVQIDGILNWQYSSFRKYRNNKVAAKYKCLKQHHIRKKDEYILSDRILEVANNNSMCVK